MSGILLFLCTTGAGFLLGMYIRKRVLQRSALFADLEKYISALRLNVTGKQQELPAFNAQFSEKASDVFCEALRTQNFSVLSASQKKCVQEFFSCLDCVGSEQLLQNLDYYQKQFQQDISASAAAAKKSSVYIKLGILLGAMVGVLFL